MRPARWTRRRSSWPLHGETRAVKSSRSWLILHGNSFQMRRHAKEVPAQASNRVSLEEGKVSRSGFAQDRDDPTDERRNQEWIREEGHRFRELRQRRAGEDLQRSYAEQPRADDSGEARPQRKLFWPRGHRQRDAPQCRSSGKCRHAYDEVACSSAEHDTLADGVYQKSRRDAVAVLAKVVQCQDCGCQDQRGAIDGPQHGAHAIIRDKRSRHAKHGACHQPYNHRHTQSTFHCAQALLLQLETTPSSSVISTPRRRYTHTSRRKEMVICSTIRSGFPSASCNWSAVWPFQYMRSRMRATTESF